jgi:curved DNA-binding protein CbpA
VKAWSKRELLAYLDRVMPVLAKSDHFELLDVAPNANATTIQGAFHTMAAGLHPDRHRNTLNPEQHEQLVIVYARIAEAYRVLRDPKNRETYLRKMARDRASSEEEEDTCAQSPEAALALLSPKAQQLYRRAIAAKRTGDLASAGLNMRMALAKHPQSGFLKAALRGLKSR